MKLTKTACERAEYPFDPTTERRFVLWDGTVRGFGAARVPEQPQEVRLPLRSRRTPAVDAAGRLRSDDCPASASTCTQSPASRPTTARIPWRRGGNAAGKRRLSASLRVTTWQRSPPPESRRRRVATSSCSTRTSFRDSGSSGRRRSPRDDVATFHRAKKGTPLRRQPRPVAAIEAHADCREAWAPSARDESQRGREALQGDSEEALPQQRRAHEDRRCDLQARERGRRASQAWADV